MHANNAAVRTDFFRETFPDLPAFKKQCGFWLRDITAGYGFVRTEGAQTIHAPHPGFRFLTWRAWITEWTAISSSSRPIALAVRPDRARRRLFGRSCNLLVADHDEGQGRPTGLAAPRRQ